MPTAAQIHDLCYCMGDFMLVLLKADSSLMIKNDIDLYIPTYSSSQRKV